MLVLVSVSWVLCRNSSADRVNQTEPQAKNISYGNRSFVIAAPTLWNTLPIELHHSLSRLCMTTFCRTLETYLGQDISITPPPTI